MDIELSICIPTYNRPLKLIKQVESIKRQLLASCELIVSDNKSDEINRTILQNYCKSNSSVEFHWQDLNLGLVGNLNFLVSQAKGRFIWLLSDDDEISDDVIEKILQKISSNPGIIFLNHMAVNKSGELMLEASFDPEKHKTLSNILAYSGTTVMLISASVYRADIIKKIYKKNTYKDIAFPLYSAFIAEDESGAEFISDICLKNLWGDESWEEYGREIFFKLVPKQLIRIGIQKNNKKISYIVNSTKYYLNYIIKIIIKKLNK